MLARYNTDQNDGFFTGFNGGIINALGGWEGTLSSIDKRQGGLIEFGITKAR